MPFDVERLFTDCKAKIQRFAIEHTDETFYAFAIDADLLCFNSNEQFAQTLQGFRSTWERQTRHIKSLADRTEEDVNDDDFLLRMAEEHNGLDRKDEIAVLKLINNHRAKRRAEGCRYHSPDWEISLRNNTGDWAYQGFADLDDEHGFDSGLYDDHYYAAMESADGHAPETEYATAMTQLVDRLRGSHAFADLERTEDFVITWVDHDY